MRFVLAAAAAHFNCISSASCSLQTPSNLMQTVLPAGKVIRARQQPLQRPQMRSVANMATTTHDGRARAQIHWSVCLAIICCYWYLARTCIYNDIFGHCQLLTTVVVISVSKFETKATITTNSAAKKRKEVDDGW